MNKLRLFYLCLVPNFLYAQCPNYVVETGNTTIEYCGFVTEPEFEIPGWPCAPFDMYQTVEFTTEGGFYPIEIVSGANYVAFPNSPINHADIIILDGCQGSLIASSYNFACAVGPYCGENSDGGPAYTAGFCLPPGTYVALIGYMNNTGLPFNAYFAQFGCISYTFGFPSFLSLPDPELEEMQEVEVLKTPQPRYRKFVIEGYGPVIKDTYTGDLYDLRTKALVR
jgi:hypothetical protein